MYGRPDDRAATLDREAPLPLYAQLAAALLGEIRAGGLRPGDRLPAEVAIRDRYRVSRATVRQALAELESRGAVRRVQGLGSFVAAGKIRHVPLLASFTELAAAQGFVPSHRVLSSEVADAPADVAADLEVAAGTRCRLLRRLLLADGDPVGLAETWLPLAALDGHDELLDADRLDDGSLYEVLQAEPIGLALDRAVETISPGVADRANAEILGCRAGTPVLLIRRVTFADGGDAVESTRLVFAGDRYEYRVELRRPTAGAPL